MNYHEAIRALNEAAHVAFWAAVKTEPRKTRDTLLRVANETDRLVNALPSYLSEN